MRTSRRLVGVAATAALAAAAVPLLTQNSATADVFTGGDLVVYRVGSGTALTNAAAPVFLDEFSPGGTLKQSLQLPTAAADGNARLTATGLSRSEGLISRSADGKYLAVTGYDAPVGASGTGGISLTATAPASVGRTVGLVDANGTVDTSTVVRAGAPSIVRSAATPDGDKLFVAGGNGGLLATSLGATSSSVAAGSATSNLAGLSYQGGKLFTSGLVTNRLAAVDTTAPSLTDLTGLPSNLLSYGYALLDLTGASYAGTGLDTLYLANGSERGGTIDKYSFNGTTWSRDGYVDVEGAFGLVADKSGSDVKLAVTTPTKLLLLTDTGAAATTFAPAAPTTLATAPTNTEFRGVALAPTGTGAPSVFVRTPSTGSTIVLPDGSFSVSSLVSGPNPVSSVKVRLGSGAPVDATKSGNVWTATVPTTGASAGSSTVTVTATDGTKTTTVTRAVTLSGTAPVPPPVVVPVPAGNASAGSYGFANPLVTRTGTWKASGPGLTSKKKASALSVKVYGSSVSLTFATGKKAGKATVTVDGQSTVVNLYAKKTGSLVKTFAFPGALQSHTVVITVTGKKAAKSKGAGVTATQFQVS